jgi:hypothetical protein
MKICPLLSALSALCSVARRYGGCSRDKLLIFSNVKNNLYHYLVFALLYLHVRVSYCFYVSVSLVFLAVITQGSAFQGEIIVLAVLLYNHFFCFAKKKALAVEQE